MPADAPCWACPSALGTGVQSPLWCPLVLSRVPLSFAHLTDGCSPRRCAVLLLVCLLWSTNCFTPSCWFHSHWVLTQCWVQLVVNITPTLFFYVVLGIRPRACAHCTTEFCPQPSRTFLTDTEVNFAFAQPAAPEGGDQFLLSGLCKLWGGLVA